MDSSQSPPGLVISGVVRLNMTQRNFFVWICRSGSNSPANVLPEPAEPPYPAISAEHARNCCCLGCGLILRVSVASSIVG